MVEIFICCAATSLWSFAFSLYTAVLSLLCTTLRPPTRPSNAYARARERNAPDVMRMHFAPGCRAPACKANNVCMARTYFVGAPPSWTCIYRTFFIMRQRVVQECPKIKPTTCCTVSKRDAVRTNTAATAADAPRLFQVCASLCWLCEIRHITRFYNVCARGASEVNMRASCASCDACGATIDHIE